ncbi:MAG: hypothetical protein Ct9H300mP7_1930 [Verrucomicrobiota bacterium]|nr:MAG: hypothetical protein Ct9H300mP7_1930 [Verrucomicrobiota bacterium]
MTAKLEDASVGIYALGSTICNWAKTVDSPWDVTVGEIDRAIPRMQRLGTKFVRIMSFKPADDADQTPDIVFERLREVTQRFLDAGLQPVHENCMNHGGMSWQHGVELLEKVPGLKWVFDTAIPSSTPTAPSRSPGPSRIRGILATRPRTHRTHPHQGLRLVDEKDDADYTFPGEGDGRVRDILCDALSNGYDAGISIEPHMAVVFHDTNIEANENDMFNNYVEYGRRLEAS